MNESEKFKLFCGKGKDYEFKSGDGQIVSFHFEPLDAVYLGDLMELVSIAQKMSKEQKEMSKEQKDQEETDDESLTVSELSKQYIGKAVELIKAMIRQSYDESVLSDRILNKFVANNYLRLLEILFELNSHLGDEQLSEESRRKIEELQNKVKSNETLQNSEVQSKG